MMPRSLFGLFLLVSLVFVTACDEEFVPIAPDGPPYSLWGNLDPTKDHQVVRVVPITGTIDEELDFSGITLRSVNRDTGEEQTWRDSVVTYEDGTRGLLFVSGFRPVHGDEYEVRVEGPEGKTAYARTTAPPAVTHSFVLDPGSQSTSGELLFPDAPRLYSSQTQYVLFFREGDLVGEPPLPSPPPRFNPCDEVVLSFDEQKSVASIEYGWKVPMNLRANFEAVNDEMDARFGIPIDPNDPNTATRPPDYGVRDIRFRTYVADEDWAPPFPFDFDPELLIEPGTLSSVRGGFGFVGSSYRVDWSWPPEVIRRLGVVTEGC